MTARGPFIALISLATAGCSTTTPAPVAPPATTPATIALVAAMTATAASGKLPSHADILKVYLAFDGTRNGALGPREWRQASLVLFDAMDQNHDGVIVRSELGGNAMIREAFPSVDEARDGKLTREEFVDLRATIFRAADIARNDFLTFAEYELLVLLRRTGWTDRDGRIAMSELGAALARAFAILDADHDGALTGHETNLFSPASRDAMDPEKTGRITVDQLINGYRFLLGADQINRNLVARAVPLYK